MKKSGWLFAVLVAAVLFGLAPNALAENSHTYERNYESNGAIGFYGKYVSPDKEKPKQDVPPNSKETVPHKKDSVSDNPSIGVDKIPQTGDESPWKSWGISLLFMMGAGLLLSKYKTQKSKEEIV
ncbi:hypothetical protein ACSMFR_11830 [Listeria aquatica]|uniref:hypothetical protein n=1 Tax=Listeria aquatica TaxID=1494960 RepID=UPI003F71FBBB